MSEQLLMIRDAATILEVGPKRLYQLLRAKGFIGISNLPRRDLVEQGLFRVELRTYVKGRTDMNNGIRKPYSVTLVTGKGLAFLRDLVEQASEPEAACKRA